MQINNEINTFNLIAYFWCVSFSYKNGFNLSNFSEAKFVHVLGNVLIYVPMRVSGEASNPTAMLVSLLPAPLTASSRRFLVLIC